MRWFYLTIVALFVAIVLIFAIQNRETVTLEFLGFSVRAPNAIMALVFYVLGAITGGTLFAFLRKSVQKARTP